MNQKKSHCSDLVRRRAGFPLDAFRRTVLADKARLHPKGISNCSEGCVTLGGEKEYDRLFEMLSKTENKNDPQHKHSLLRDDLDLQG